MKNTIPVSQLQKGDIVLYRNGDWILKSERFSTVKDIKDLFNGTVRLTLSNREDMIVLKKGEIIIRVD